MFFFRDGEAHSGEASLTDIAAGIEEGELLEHTVVLVDGDWVNGSKFM